MVKRTHLLVGLALLVFFLVAGNWLYRAFFWHADLEKYAPALAKLEAEKVGTQVLYLGDCSDKSADDADADSSSISTLLQTHFPKWNITGVSHDGYHAEMYLKLLQHVENVKSIEHVVVTLNLRTFSAHSLWNDYTHSFNQSAVLMRPYPPLVNRLLLSFGAYPQPSDEDILKNMEKAWKKDTLHFPYPFEYKTAASWNEGVANGSYTFSDNSWDQERIKQACFTIKDFALELDEQHALIKALDDVVQLADINNWNLVFNLLPENMDQIENQAGPDLVFLINKNRDYLISRYDSPGVHVIDNLETLPPSCFIEDNPNEHYNEAGRKKIAISIARELEKNYPWESMGIPKHQLKQWASSSNDLESPFWMNLNSLANSEVHSGKLAAKLSVESPYSPTFVYLLPRELQSTPFQIEVDFYALILTLDTNIRIVIERVNNQTDSEWSGIGLSDIDTIKTGMWQHFNNRFQIEPSTLPTKSIKVYIFHNGQDPIYVDDLKISVDQPF